MYAAVVGIEILCIAAAEIGENTNLHLFVSSDSGFNPFGIAVAYLIGYALAGFTTFVTILGRYNYSYSNQSMINSCCSSILEQETSNKGSMSNLKITFRNFALGLKKNNNASQTI